MILIHSHSCSLSDDELGKENELCSTSIKSKQKSSSLRAQNIKTPKRPPFDYRSADKNLDPKKLQVLFLFLLSFTLIYMYVVKLNTEFLNCAVRYGP